MIINGGKRAFWRKFAPHLMNTEKGMQEVRVVEMRGLAADNLSDAFQELEALGSGTRAKSFYYHANIDPRADEHMTEEQWEHAADMLENNLGLEGRSRFVVEHTKNGRVHRHIVWSRVTDDMKVVPCDWNYSIHQRTADELEKEFGHEKTPRQRAPGKPRGPKQYEYVRSKQSKIHPKEVEAELTALWHQADSGPALAAAIAEHGYILAEGKRGLCIVDPAGHEHSLARRCGVRVKDVDARMADVLDRETLPTVEEARKLARERAAGRDRDDEVKQPDPAPPPADQAKARDTGRTLQTVAEGVLHTAKDAIAGKERGAPSPADSPEPEPEQQAAPRMEREPTAFERLARKLTEAVQAFGGGLTAAESVDPARQPAAPPSGPPGHPAPGAFERLVTELTRDAKEAAPIAEELAVPVAAALEHHTSGPSGPELSEFERVTEARTQALKEAGGDGLFITEGLAWTAGQITPASDPPPTGRELTPFERVTRENNQALRSNGGEPYLPGGESFWSRTVSRLRATHDRVASWTTERFDTLAKWLRGGTREPGESKNSHLETFVGRLLESRNTNPTNPERER
jgi:hypothetical protein